MPDNQETLLKLMKKNKIVSDMLHKQNMPRQDLVESLVHKQNLAQLNQALDKTAPAEIAHLLTNLSPEEQLVVWGQVNNERKLLVLRELPLPVLQVLGNDVQNCMSLAHLRPHEMHTSCFSFCTPKSLTCTLIQITKNSHSP